MKQSRVKGKQVIFSALELEQFEIFSGDRNRILNRDELRRAFIEVLMWDEAKAELACKSIYEWWEFNRKMEMH